MDNRGHRGRRSPQRNEASPPKGRGAFALKVSAMVLDVSIHADIKALTKNLSALAYKQLPYAQAQAVTSLAKRVREAEVKLIKSTFPTSTPFTLNSVGVKAARKGDPTAIVFVKDIAAQYLKPFKDGGQHFLGSKRGLLVPIDAAVNQYGNLPRGALAKLKGRPDVFIGTVKTKSGGTINGVWQRPYMRGLDTSKNMSPAMRRKIRGQGKQARGANTTGHLKLLIRFKDSPEVKQHLGWGSTAQTTVRTWWQRDFDAAMSKAMASAR